MPRKKTLFEFIEEANKVHHYKYNYSKGVYVGSQDKIIITCPLHGDFRQRPDHHLEGKECNQCSNVWNQADLLKEFYLIHQGKYNYSEVNFSSIKDKIKITCNIHGVFYQKAYHHLAGHACNKCNSSVSKLETKWLDQLNIARENRQFVINDNANKFVVDGFCPNTYTIYEFYGDYWHGNPKIFAPNNLNVKVGKTFGELYDKTIKREDRLKNLNFNLVSIWQSDYRG